MDLWWFQSFSGMNIYLLMGIYGCTTNWQIDIYDTFMASDFCKSTDLYEYGYRLIYNDLYLEVSINGGTP